MLLGGCFESSVDGEIVSNETSLVLSHEHATQSTPSGVRILVEVTLENDGTEPITADGRVPRIVCTFRNDSGESLYESGRRLTDSVEVGETTTVEFPMAVNVDDVTRYELRSEWVDE